VSEVQEILNQFSINCGGGFPVQLNSFEAIVKVSLSSVLQVIRELVSEQCEMTIAAGRKASLVSCVY